MDIKSEQERFWRIFEKKLIENGKPFSILHEKDGIVTNWAVINKRHSFVDNALSVDLLLRENQIRTNIYMRNSPETFSYLFERNKNIVNSLISKKVMWMQGIRSPKTRRIAYFSSVQPNSIDSYEKSIDEILPILIEMKAVCELFAKDLFFDF